MLIPRPPFSARLGADQAINFSWSSYGSYFGETQSSQNNNNSDKDNNDYLSDKQKIAFSRVHQIAVKLSKSSTFR